MVYADGTAKMTYRRLRRGRLFALVVPFIWISFFAPQLTRGWRFLFLPVAAGLLWNVLRAGPRAVWSRIRNDTTFWGLWVIMLLSCVLAPSFLSKRYFAYFFLPAPLLYFLSKLSFDKKDTVILLRLLCAVAAAVACIGIVEFAAKRNILYESLCGNFYYALFRGKRAFSTQFHPAALGTYLAVMIPLNVSWYRAEDSRLYKGYACAGMVLMAAALLLSFSRGALAALIVACSVMIAGEGRRRRLGFLLVAGGVIAVIAASSWMWEKGYAAGYLLSVQGLYARAASQAVYGLERLRTCVNIFSSNILVGAGLGQVKVLFDTYRHNPLIAYAPADKVADSMFLTLLAETGIAGCAAFAVFAAALLMRVGKLIHAAQTQEYFAAGAFAGFCGMLFNFLTYDALYWPGPNYLFWWYTGILAALAKDR